MWKLALSGAPMSSLRIHVKFKIYAKGMYFWVYTFRPESFSKSGSEFQDLKYCMGVERSAGRAEGSGFWPQIVGSREVALFLQRHGADETQGSAFE
jgi:hypothetical protein